MLYTIFKAKNSLLKVYSALSYLCVPAVKKVSFSRYKGKLSHVSLTIHWIHWIQPFTSNLGFSVFMNGSTLIVFNDAREYIVMLKKKRKKKNYLLIQIVARALQWNIFKLWSQSGTDHRPVASQGSHNCRIIISQLSYRNITTLIF